MLVTQMLKQKKAHRIVTIGPETVVAEAAKILKEEHIGALMVTGDDGKLIGMISIGNVVKSRVDELEDEEAHMRNFIAGVE